MDQLNVVEVFDSAVSIVRNLPKEGPIQPSDELKLKFYAYFKQATHGPNDTPKPRFYQIVEAYKWQAWQKLGDMPKREAMLCYINELKQVMESIPQDETSLEASKDFEEVLGKKFYDYWFGQWNRPNSDTEVTTNSGTDAKRIQSQNLTRSDTQSNSSGGSSVSMLEETQSHNVEGFKNTVNYEQTVAGQLSDQFALAILRLQHSLDGTTKRLDKLESQLKLSLESIRVLEAQTHAKQTIPIGQVGTRNTHTYRRSSLGIIADLMSQFKSVHWFYISYPIVIYLAMSALDGRRRRNNPGR